MLLVILLIHCYLSSRESRPRGRLNVPFDRGELVPPDSQLHCISSIVDGGMRPTPAPCEMRNFCRAGDV